MRILILCFALLTVACTPKKTKLPYIGQHEINGTDTLYHQIPDFSFTNQDSATITNDSFKEKLYIADFFFIACPTICPRVKKQMLRIHEKFLDNDHVVLVSHTLAPKYDSVEALRIYAKNLGVSSDKWQFLHGEKDDIWDIGAEYFVAIAEDKDAPGGLDHSGKIILVDENRHVRSFCDGTDPESVDRFLEDIDLLLKEYE